MDGVKGTMECLLKDDSILLAARIVASNKLADAGFPQKRIAKALACSQAMVSKYLKSSSPKLHRHLIGEMEILSKNMAELMKEGVGEEGILFYFCEHLFEWRKKGLICNLCNKGVLSLNVFEKEREKRLILQDLTDACEFISKNSKFLLLNPQVRMNIARCTENPSSKSEVASIPGRLVSIGTKVFAVASPEFGISGHLAEILLRVSKNNSHLRAVMNVRLGKDVIRAAGKAGLPLTHSEKNVKILLANRGDSGKSHASTFLLLQPWKPSEWH